MNEAVGGQEPSIEQERGEVIDNENENDIEEAADDESFSQQERFGRICLFCDKLRKVHNYRVLPIHSCEVEKMRKDISEIINECADNEMNEKLNSVLLNGKVYYYNVCRQISYQNDKETTIGN